MNGAAGAACFYESTMWWFYGKDKFLWKVYDKSINIITSLLNGKIHKVPKNKLSFDNISKPWAFLLLHKNIIYFNKSFGTYMRGSFAYILMFTCVYMCYLKS